MQLDFLLFWLFFVFRLVVIPLMVVQGGEACLPTAPSCLEVLIKVFIKKSLYIHHELSLPVNFFNSYYLCLRYNFRNL